MRIILLGAPGAGKGTQAKKLTKELHIPHISTGDIFRRNISEGTPVGLRAKEYIDKGLLVPDSVTLQLVSDSLNGPECREGFLLDGFPRTLTQAAALENEVKIDAAIDIAVDKSKLTARLCGRRSCPECGGTYHIKALNSESCPECGTMLICRKDDNEETVKKRLEVYEEQTAPLIEYYKRQGKLISVDGSREVETVFADIISRLKDALY